MEASKIPSHVAAEHTCPICGKEMKTSIIPKHIARVHKKPPTPTKEKPPPPVKEKAAPKVEPAKKQPPKVKPPPPKPKLVPLAVKKEIIRTVLRVPAFYAKIVKRTNEYVTESSV